VAGISEANVLIWLQFREAFALLTAFCLVYFLSKKNLVECIFYQFKNRWSWNSSTRILNGETFYIIYRISFSRNYRIENELFNLSKVEHLYLLPYMRTRNGLLHDGTRRKTLNRRELGSQVVARAMIAVRNWQIAVSQGVCVTCKPSLVPPVCIHQGQASSIRSFDEFPVFTGAKNVSNKSRE
jgi:hypothetical protein